MTTATLVTHGRTMDTEMVRPRRSLEELVDRLMDAMFPANTETEEPSATRSIHEARRLRQAGDVDGGLAILAGMDMGKAETREARWPSPSGIRWSDGGSETGARCSTDREPAGHRLWCPTATAGCLRSLRSWGCAGGPARSSPGAVSGVCGPSYRVRGRL